MPMPAIYLHRGGQIIDNQHLALFGHEPGTETA